MSYYIAGINVSGKPRVIELKGRATKAQFILDKEATNDTDAGWLVGHRSRIPLDELHTFQDAAIQTVIDRFEAKKRDLEREIQQLDDKIKGLKSLPEFDIGQS